MSSFMDHRYTVGNVEMGIYHQDDYYKVHKYGYRAYSLNKGKMEVIYPYRDTLRKAEKDLDKIRQDHMDKILIKKMGG